MYRTASGFVWILDDVEHTFITTRRPAGDPRPAGRARRFRGPLMLIVAVAAIVNDHVLAGMIARYMVN
jgi:hypothetical protein